MNTEQMIKNSKWWKQAQEMPDRHYELSEKIYLSDHLEAVFRNLRFLGLPNKYHEFYSTLINALITIGQDPVILMELLQPVALLHDIGKTKEDKGAECEHPLTGKTVKMRHPIMSVIAGLEILPEDLSNRETMLALIEEHDTPFSWYLQFEKSGQVPKKKSWAKLDRAIDPRENGTGIIMLAVFKLADIDGHENVEDVSWFIDQANINYLLEKGKWLPVPSDEAIRSLDERQL